MKKSSGIFLVFIILSIISRITLSQSPPSAWPTFSMTVRNITSYPGPNGQDSILTFDVYMLQTNFGQHGIDPFEYCCAQYFWFFNKNIFRNPSIGNLKLTNLGNQTDVPPEIRPASFLVDSSDFFGPDVGILGVAGRSGYSYLNFFINSIFPGTKMLKLKLTTSGHQWNFAPLNLRFKLNNAPYTFVAYFTPYTPGTDTSKSPPQYVQALLDTNINQYIVENYFVLPVELENFVSIVSGNNVELNWTTTAETNNQKFEIERSNSNLIEWTKIGEVQGSGTTSEPRNYNFTDRKLNTGHYKYRLKQIDFNGTENYHELSAEVIVGIPTAYALSQNYPNPFNPTTKIDYELPYDGKVSIVMYDISGREVAKLVNEVKTAGYYSVQFNGANLASGMYFYRINAQGNTNGQNFVNTKKMVLIK